MRSHSRLKSLTASHHSQKASSNTASVGTLVPSKLVFVQQLALTAQLLESMEVTACEEKETMLHSVIIVGVFFLPGFNQVLISQALTRFD